MAADELERLINRTPRTDLIDKVKSEYSQSTTPGKVYTPIKVPVYTPLDNSDRSKNVGKRTKVATTC